MRATVLWMALALTALAVSSGAARADRSSPVADSCPEAPEIRYFPVGVLDGRDRIGAFDLDLFVRQWFSKHLAAMEEPSLSCGALEDAETYRFLWLRSFDNPIAVRVFRRGGTYRAEAVIMDSDGGNGPGNVSRRVTKELSSDQWQAVLAKLEGVQLWQMATASHAIRGTDGAEWIVEARRNGRYHVVFRWSGRDGLESVGRLFLDLADLGDVGPVY